MHSKDPRKYSKRHVKTYPQQKINFRGITFEEWTVTDLSHFPPLSVYDFGG